MAELVDALDLGSSSREGVGVRVPSLAPEKESSRMANNAKLKFFIETINPSLPRVYVTVPAPFIDSLFSHAAQKQQEYIHTHGFQKGETPIGYIKQHFKMHICEHIKEFLFKYIVLPFFYHHLHEAKLTLAGEPRLTNIKLEPHQDAVYQFDISLAPSIAFKDWKSFLFKAPKRKKYKDIDKQVELFITQEKEAKKQQTDDGIHIGDWVCFDIILIDENNTSLLRNSKENLWIKIGGEEVDIPSKDTFLNKKVTSSFCSNNSCFQEYFSTELNTKYTFRIDIVDVIHHEYFCFDAFKKHFSIKSQKDLFTKLIEVYSFRNDLSQRRTTIDEAFKVILAKHSIDVPSQVTLREQKNVLDSVRENPDYQVYKTEKQFEKYIRLLAEKQAKEQIIIDQLIHAENITTSHDDIKNYLTFTQRPRMKEFIYFRPPITKYKGQEMPISSSILQHCCMREKTLNYVIHHLTRK